MFNQLQNLDLYDPQDLIENDGKINEVKMGKDLFLDFFNVSYEITETEKWQPDYRNLKSSLPACSDV